ncbi:hypothetical protein ACFPOD_04980 [Nitratireductor kimnyeongensis]|uniref:Uncharacterized protein n=1 Tax=Nitratireductor kimnyeongensis TaxID=430679 RepID=A0ABW0T6C9_9HYPH|nr:hypothetical protein [Nitratireductor kimnyeongensis]QZZ34563.1 hypothetical protein KW403_12215 [Nitratireductor kimnyeongensis]
MRSDISLRFSQLPETLTFPDGTTSNKENAEKHIIRRYGYPRVGYVLPAAGGGKFFYAAFIPDIETDDEGERVREGQCVSWHSTYESASRRVRRRYIELAKINYEAEFDFGFDDEEYLVAA